MGKVKYQRFGVIDYIFVVYIHVWEDFAHLISFWSHLYVDCCVLLWFTFFWGGGIVGFARFYGSMSGNILYFLVILKMNRQKIEIQGLGMNMDQVFMGQVSYADCRTRAPRVKKHGLLLVSVGFLRSSVFRCHGVLTKNVTWNSALLVNVPNFSGSMKRCSVPSVFEMYHDIEPLNCQHFLTYIYN